MHENPLSNFQDLSIHMDRQFVLYNVMTMIQGEIVKEIRDVSSL